MLIELALVAVVVMLVVRSMIRSSEARIMEYCRSLAVRGFEATAAASGRTPEDLLGVMDDDDHRDDFTPPAPRS